MKSSKQKVGCYKPRGKGLSKHFMDGLTCFTEVIRYAKNPKNELDIQLRGGYLDIYYKGGRLLRMRGLSTLDFDEGYFYDPRQYQLRMSDVKKLCDNDYMRKKDKSMVLKNISDSELERMRKIAVGIKKMIKKNRDEVLDKLRNSHCYEDVSSVMGEMKDVMNEWKKSLSQSGIRNSEIGERVVQHYISLFNREYDSEGDFVVLDIEYEISTRAQYANEKGQDKRPRIDVLAVHKGTGQLYVMELKYGMKSVNGDASAKKHYEDYLQTVGYDSKWKYFIEDAKILLSAKQEWGLIDNRVSIIDQKPIFSFIMKCEKPSDKDEFRQHLKSEKMDQIPTIFLPEETDYNNPKVSGHLLKL